MGKFLRSDKDQIGTSQEQAEAFHGKDEQGRTYQPAQQQQEEIPSVVAVSVEKAVELDKRLNKLVAECEDVRRELNRLFGTGAPPISLARIAGQQ